MQSNGDFKKSKILAEAILKVNPLSSKAFHILGRSLLFEGDRIGACANLAKSLKLNSNCNDAWFDFGVSLRNLELHTISKEFESLVVEILRRDCSISPEGIGSTIISMLNKNSEISNILINLSKDYVDSNLEEIFLTLQASDLLVTYLHLASLPSLKYEALFTQVRRSWLMQLSYLEDDSKYEKFLTALSQQCFISQYIYNELPEETEQIETLETEIASVIANNHEPSCQLLVCLASYRRLDQYDWSINLKDLTRPKKIIKTHLEETEQEFLLKRTIPKLSAVDCGLSCRVLKQYEENPYPRWIKSNLPAKSLSFENWCEKAGIAFRKDYFAPGKTLKVLIAGCGTGRQAISTAKRFQNCQVEAIDLSLTSLSYAKRKTTELGISNINYSQADIMTLANHSSRYDLIECVGVLHHLKEPEVGWSILVKLLKDGGLMKVGLYSRSARKEIRYIRESTPELDDLKTIETLRGVRNRLNGSNRLELNWLSHSPDWFNASGFRDLIMHEHETQFNLLEIKQCLMELGLRFCGFEHNKFDRDRVAEKDWQDLDAWHEYELSNPRAFGAMYIFWCQRISITN